VELAEGDVYPIRTDFRAGIAFCTAAQTGKPLHAKWLIELFFPSRVPEDPAAAVEAALAFFRCGAPKQEQTETSNPSFSFTADSEALCAAFLQEYRIDLTTAELHWWRFMALLRALLEPTFAERVEIRTTNSAELKDSKARIRLRRLQRRYALDRNGAPLKEPTTLEEYEALLLAQARGER